MKRGLVWMVVEYVFNIVNNSIEMLIILKCLIVFSVNCHGGATFIRKNKCLAVSPIVFVLILFAHFNTVFYQAHIPTLCNKDIGFNQEIRICIWLYRVCFFNHIVRSKLSLLF